MTSLHSKEKSKKCNVYYVYSKTCYKENFKGKNALREFLEMRS